MTIKVCCIGDIVISRCAVGETKIKADNLNSLGFTIISNDDTYIDNIINLFNSLRFFVYMIKFDYETILSIKDNLPKNKKIKSVIFDRNASIFSFMKT